MSAVLAYVTELVRVCGVADVPIGEGRATNVRGRRIAVFHTARGWFALADRCPHRGGPLSDGIVADSCVTCPLHERRFDLASGERVGAAVDDDAVASYEVVVRGPDVFVALQG